MGQGLSWCMVATIMLQGVTNSVRLRPATRPSPHTSRRSVRRQVRQGACEQCLSWCKVVTIMQPGPSPTCLFGSGIDPKKHVRDEPSSLYTSRFVVTRVMACAGAMLIVSVFVPIFSELLDLSCHLLCRSHVNRFCVRSNLSGTSRFVVPFLR